MKEAFKEASEQSHKEQIAYLRKNGGEELAKQMEKQTIRVTNMTYRKNDISAWINYGEEKGFLDFIEFKERNTIIRLLKEALERKTGLRGSIENIIKLLEK